MAQVANHQSLGAPFGNALEFRKVVWDYAKDSSSLTAVDLMTAVEDLLIASFHAVVKTTCTSGGAATVDFGVTGTDNKFVAAAAVASLTAGAVLNNAAIATTPFKLASGDKVTMDVDTAVLTAGKIEVTIGVMKI